MSAYDTQPIRAFPSYQALVDYMHAESRRNKAQQWERQGEIGRLLALETARVWNKAALLLNETIKEHGRLSITTAITTSEVANETTATEELETSLDYHCSTI